MKSIYQLLLTCILLFIGQRVDGDSVTKRVHFSQTAVKCNTITGEDGLVYNFLSFPETENDSYKVGAPTLPVKYVTIPLPYAYR